MQRAEVRDGYVYVIDTNTGQEKAIHVDAGGKVVSAQVTGDNEVTVSLDSYGGDQGNGEVKYNTLTGFRA